MQPREPEPDNERDLRSVRFPAAVTFRPLQLWIIPVTDRELERIARTLAEADSLDPDGHGVVFLRDEVGKPMAVWRAYLPLARRMAASGMPAPRAGDGGDE